MQLNNGIPPDDIPPSMVWIAQPGPGGGGGGGGNQMKEPPKKVELPGKEDFGSGRQAKACRTTAPGDEGGYATSAD